MESEQLFHGGSYRNSYNSITRVSGDEELSDGAGVIMDFQTSEDDSLVDRDAAAVHDTVHHVDGPCQNLVKYGCVLPYCDEYSGPLDQLKHPASIPFLGPRTQGVESILPTIWWSGLSWCSGDPVTLRGQQSLPCRRTKSSILGTWLHQCLEDFYQPPEFPFLKMLLAYIELSMPGSDLEHRRSFSWHSGSTWSLEAEGDCEEDAGWVMGSCDAVTSCLFSALDPGPDSGPDSGTPPTLPETLHLGSALLCHGPDKDFHYKGTPKLLILQNLVSSNSKTDGVQV
ncbi:hypothetical protein CB1_000449044 [Camelus ferus]|nr:hypothetical protein CB1_000449044 [Camelus ferus]